MASTVSWSAAIAAVHADPILANANPPLTPSANFAIPSFLGEAAKAAKNQAPYVIWHMDEGKDRYDRALPPRDTGSAFGPTPRWLWTRWVYSRCYIHCLQSGPADFDTMELTLNSFIAAVHRTLRGSYNLLGGGLEKTSGTELTKDRKVYLLDLEIATPITETAILATTATITSVPISDGINTQFSPPK